MRQIIFIYICLLNLIFYELRADESNSKVASNNQARVDPSTQVPINKPIEGLYPFRSRFAAWPRNTGRQPDNNEVQPSSSVGQPSSSSDQKISSVGQPSSSANQKISSAGQTSISASQISSSVSLSNSHTGQLSSSVDKKISSAGMAIISSNQRSSSSGQQSISSVQKSSPLGEKSLSVGQPNVPAVQSDITTTSTKLNITADSLKNDTVCMKACRDFKKFPVDKDDEEKKDEITKQYIEFMDKSNFFTTHIDELISACSNPDLAPCMWRCNKRRLRALYFGLGLGGSVFLFLTFLFSVSYAW